MKNHSRKTGIHGVFQHSLAGIAAIAILSAVVCSTACAGTVRFDLPKLVGEYQIDGSGDTSRLDADGDKIGDIFKAQRINTSLYPPHVASAKVIILGTQTPGKAHGDGVVRRHGELDLVGSVAASFGTDRSVFLSLFGTSNSEFRIEKEFQGPFFGTIPLPCPCERPPWQFSPRVGVQLGVSFESQRQYPHPIDPGNPLLRGLEGLVVDVPVVATITEAYLLLTGPNLVPEPTSIHLVFAALAASWCALPRRRDPRRR